MRSRKAPAFAFGSSGTTFTQRPPRAPLLSCLHPAVFVGPAPWSSCRCGEAPGAGTKTFAGCRARIPLRPLARQRPTSPAFNVCSRRTMSFRQSFAERQQGKTPACPAPKVGKESLHGLNNRNLIFRPEWSIREEISPHCVRRNDWTPLMFTIGH